MQIISKLCINSLNNYSEVIILNGYFKEQEYLQNNILLISGYLKDEQDKRTSGFVQVRIRRLY